jgi:hypothetical protein
VKVRITGYFQEGTTIEMSGCCLSQDQRERRFPLDTFLMVSWRERPNSYGSAGRDPSVALAEGGEPQWLDIEPTRFSRIQEVPASQYPFYFKELLNEAQSISNDVEAPSV